MHIIFFVYYTYWHIDLSGLFTESEIETQREKYEETLEEINTKVSTLLEITDAF